MSILAYALLVASFLGIGTLASSILSAQGARIGLGAVAFLALVVDATWLLAPGLGWSSDLIDVLVIAAFGVVVLAAAMTESYYRGTPAQERWTWPSARDLAFLLVVIALFGAIVMVLPVPLDTDAQGFGYLALMLRDGALDPL